MRTINFSANSTFLRAICRNGRWAHFSAPGRRAPCGSACLLVAIFLIIGGILGIVLPVLGFWMVPLGLALLAIDLPFLRGPFTRLLAFINRKLASQAG